MSFKDAVAGGGAVLAIVAAVVGFTGGAVIENQADVIPASPAGFDCPKDWAMTGGTDPDSGEEITSCQSPDKRYIITSKGGNAPQAFDTETGTFIDVSQFK